MAQALEETDQRSGSGLKILTFRIVLLSPAPQHTAAAESHGALKDVETLKAPACA
ncbi:MAG: hypothetical protein OXT71_06350 [Acidobacteriota bacterium]|nr:hypothetical protein [Acidobacteriota bacterium]